MKLAIYCPGGSDLAVGPKLEESTDAIVIPDLSTWANYPPLPMLDAYWEKLVSIGAVGGEVTIAFLLTRQTPSHPKDTARLKELLEVWAHSKGIQKENVAIAHIDSPHSRMAMMSTLPDLLDTLIDNVGPTEVFMSQGPSTDAINAAVLVSMLSGLRLRLPVSVIELVGERPDGTTGAIKEGNRVTRADVFDPSLVTSRLVRKEIESLLEQDKIGNAASLYSLAPEPLATLLQLMLRYLSGVEGAGRELATEVGEFATFVSHCNDTLEVTCLVSQMLDVIECVAKDHESIQQQALPLMIFQIVQDLLPTIWLESGPIPVPHEPTFTEGSSGDAGMTDRDSDKENRDRAKRLLLAAGPPQWHHFPRGKGKRIELDASGDQNDLVRIWAYLRDAVSKDRNKLAHGTGRSPEQLLPLLHSLVARAKDRGKLGDLLQDDALDPSNLRLLLKRFQPAIPDRNLLDLAVKRALELCS